MPWEMPQWPQARCAENGVRPKLPNTAVLLTLTQPRLLGRVGQGAKEHQHARCKGLPDLTLPLSQKPAENMSQFLHSSVQGSGRGSRKGWTEKRSSGALGERTGWNTANSHATAKPSQPATGPGAALARCRRGDSRGARRTPFCNPSAAPRTYWSYPRHLGSDPLCDPGLRAERSGPGQGARSKAR